MYDDTKATIAGISAGLFLFIAALVLIAVIGFAGWRLNWWFAQKNADMQAHVIRHGYSNQTSLRDDLTRKLGEVQAISVQIVQAKGTDLEPALKAQRYAIATIVCREASQITGDPLPQDQAQFVNANCSLGNVSLNSELKG